MTDPATGLASSRSAILPGDPAGQAAVAVSPVPSISCRTPISVDSFACWPTARRLMWFQPGNATANVDELGRLT